MVKKIFIAFSILLSLSLLSSFVFATDAIQDGAKDVGSEVKNSWNKLGNAVQNIGNDAKGAVNNTNNSINDQNDNNNMINQNNNNAINDNNTSNYTASRTAANTNNSGALFGMNSTMWTWLIMAILGVVIVALVWYYGAENTTGSHKRNS